MVIQEGMVCVYVCVYVCLIVSSFLLQSLFVYLFSLSSLGFRVEWDVPFQPIA